MLAVVALALAAPVLGLDASFIHVDAALLPPFSTWPHPLGTDDLGRDMLARLSVGAQISLSLGALTGLIAVGFGGLYGIAAATGPRWLDTLLVRLIDILYSLPGLMVVLLLAIFLAPGLQVVLQGLGSPEAGPWAQVLSLILALALFSWPDAARIIRTETKRLMQEAYIEASQSMGMPVAGLIRQHLVPNLLPYLLVSFTLTVPRAILTESTLSFIGLGVEAPLSSWGTLAAEGWQLLRVAPWLLIFPGVCLVLSMLALHGLSMQLDNKVS